MPDLFNANELKAQPQADSPSAENIPQTVNPLSGLNEKKIRTFLPKKRGNSLSAFWILPSKGVTFETQDPQEEILLILRAHWLTNIPWLIVATLLSLAPLLLTYFPLLSGFPARYQTIAVVIWYLVVLMYVFEKFLTWFFNLCIVTDERIVDVDFHNLTSRRIADAELDKIQDVTFTNTGVVGTIFNFGNVLVQTAAEMTEFIFENVPGPARVAEILQQLRTEEKIEALEGRIR